MQVQQQRTLMAWPGGPTPSACSASPATSSATSSSGSCCRRAATRFAKVAAEGGTPAWHMCSKADWAKGRLLLA